MIGAQAAAWMAAAGSLAAMVAIPVLGVLCAREWAAMRRRAEERRERGCPAERPETEAADEFPMAEGGR